MSHPTGPAFDDQPVSVRLQLAAAWTSVMFVYVYVDILNFFTPGTVADILDGRVFEFDLSQVFSTSALLLMSVPSCMVVLSTVLPARVARTTNLIAAGLFVPVTVFNLAGESWLWFYGLGVAVELVILGLILRLAWSWPRARAAVAQRSAGTVTAAR